MKKVLVVMLVALLFSCKKEESVSSDVMSAPQSPAPVTAVAKTGDAQNAGADRASIAGGVAAAPADTVQTQMPRIIVRTAQMRIVVADTTKAIDAVTKSVEAMGGFVSDSNVWREGELLHATLKLRVPAEKLTSTLSSIRQLSRRVETETIASEDVSQEYVDLDSQVRNLEATEAEPRELLIVARKNSRKAADVLEVHEQLSLIRGQIEQAKGRMRYLSQVAAMSQVSLEVLPDVIAQPVVQEGWRPLVVARDAMRALVSALQSIGTVAIWLLLYVVPIFGILGLVIVGLWKLVRKSRRRQSTD